MIRWIGFLALGTLATAGAFAQDSRLDAVIKSGVLRVCTPGDYKPFSLAKPDASYDCGGQGGCPWVFVHVPPGSSLTFNARGRWVKVTGHIGDPAAAACHYVYPSDSTQNEKLPDSDAQRWCSEGFVVETRSVSG